LQAEYAAGKHNRDADLRRVHEVGPERALVYRLAVQTGIRASELASLTRASFELDGERPCVRVSAA
jgi:integrase